MKPLHIAGFVALGFVIGVVLMRLVRRRDASMGAQRAHSAMSDAAPTSESIADAAVATLAAPGYDAPALDVPTASLAPDVGLAYSGASLG